MKRAPIIIVWILTLCAILVPYRATAVKAAAKIVKYRQPDGSIISLVICGDEFYGYSKTPSGVLVYQGPDRFFYKDGKRLNFCKSNDNAGSICPSYISGTDQVQPAILRELGINNLFKGALGAPAISKQKCQFSHTMEHTVLPQQEQINALVLLVEFSDVKFSVENPLDYFFSMLNGSSFMENGATGSVAAYLNDNFGGKCRFSFDLHGIITLDEPVGYYGGRTAFLNDANPGKMVEQACRAAFEAGVDFSKYDSNSDGVVDNVAIIFAGYNEAESGDGTTIWPHYGNILNDGVTVGNCKIGGYTCASEYTGENTAKMPASIGTFLHEFLHYLGLPDMYDVNGEEEGASKALYGSLSIMDGGNYLNDGHTPPYFTSIEREILGLAQVEDIKPDSSYVLPPIEESSKLYRIRCGADGEYFLLECRRSAGWDAYIGGSGMVVYHIDKSENVIAGISAAERWRLNVINSYAPHQCAYLLPAGSPGENSVDLSAIFYPGSTFVTSLASQGDPHLSDWSGMGLGVSLEDIAYRQQRVTFKTSADVIYDERLPYVSSVSVDPYQNGAFVKWNAVGGSGENSAGREQKWNISVVDPQTGEILYEDITDRNYTAVEGVEPESEYELSISCSSGLSVGKGFSTRFTTLPVSSIFSYMAVKGTYRVGDVLHINLQNTATQETGIVVKINGNVCSGKFYTFEQAGNYFVEISILLPDGSLEIICKHIKVN